MFMFSLPKNKNNKKGIAGYMRQITKCWQLYVMLLPALVIIFLFRYLPIYGVQLAFQRLFPGRPLSSATFIGLQNFERFFSSPWFKRIITNTVNISLMTLIFEFPVPVILAILLHTTDSKRVKRISQGATFIPYLLSTVIIISIMQIMCRPDLGIINILLSKSGQAGVYFFGEEKFVMPLYVVSEIWKFTGFTAIIYYAALQSIDGEIIEASIIDGCTLFRRIMYIDLPIIAPTIITMLILKVGRVFQLGTEKVLLLQNDLNIGASEVMATYSYKMGIVENQLGYSTAIGLLINVVNFIILLVMNRISKKFTGSSIY